MIFKSIALMATTMIFLVGKPAIADEVQNTLTHGQVQMTLKVGETTQLEVAEVFGSPNITTIDGSGQEVWIYNRHATVTQSKTKSTSFGIILGALGGDVGGGGGIGHSNQTSGFEQSSRSMTLIIKFNSQKVVSDFRSRASSF